MNILKHVFKLSDDVSDVVIPALQDGIFFPSAFYHLYCIYTSHFLSALYGIGFQGQSQGMKVKHSDYFTFHISQNPEFM